VGPLAVGLNDCILLHSLTGPMESYLAPPLLESSSSLHWSFLLCASVGICGPLAVGLEESRRDVTTVVPCPLSTKRTGESPHSLTL
jgi:hypothetical protein